MRLLDGMPLEHLELLDMEHLQATMTPTNVRVATEQQRLTGLSAAPGGVTAPSSALPAFAEAGAAQEPRQGAATEQHDDSDHGSAGTSADSDEEVTGEHIKVLCGVPRWHTSAHQPCFDVVAVCWRVCEQAVSQHILHLVAKKQRSM